MWRQLAAQVILGSSLVASTLAGQQLPEHPWTFRARVVMTGNSAESEPAGYEMYSAITLEVGLTRRVARVLGLELDVRTESREVDYAPESGTVERLGSLELLPVNLLVQFRPVMNGKVHLFAGGGVNFTSAWEKSGVLDSMDVAPSLRPAIQLGLDLDLSPGTLLNFELRWNGLTTDIENDGVRYTSLKVDPITLGIGLGFRF